MSGLLDVSTTGHEAALTISAEHSVLDVWRGSDSVSDNCCIWYGAKIIGINHFFLYRSCFYFYFIFKSNKKGFQVIAPLTPPMRIPPRHKINFFENWFREKSLHKSSDSSLFLKFPNHPCFSLKNYLLWKADVVLKCLCPGNLKYSRNKNLWWSLHILCENLFYLWLF